MASGEIAAVHIWRVRVDAPIALEAVSAGEREHAARFHRLEDRDAYLGAHAALRRVLAAWIGVPQGALVFERGCEHCGDPHHGRPVLADAARPSFSLSRSGALALVAVLDDGTVGVDVEAVGRLGTWEAVREGFFTPEERIDYDRETAARLWARKEAVAKALGLGLILPFREVDVRGDGGWTEARIDEPARSGLPDTVRDARPIVRDVPAPQGYLAAVAVRDGQPRELVIDE